MYSELGCQCCAILKLFSYIFTSGFKFQMALPFSSTNVYSWCKTRAEGYSMDSVNCRQEDHVLVYMPGRKMFYQLSAIPVFFWCQNSSNDLYQSYSG
jgi:hypothetical protein